MQISVKQTFYGPNNNNIRIGVAFNWKMARLYTAIFFNEGNFQQKEEAATKFKNLLNEKGIKIFDTYSLIPKIYTDKNGKQQINYTLYCPNNNVTSDDEYNFDITNDDGIPDIKWE